MKWLQKPLHEFRQERAQRPATGRTGRRWVMVIAQGYVQDGQWARFGSGLPASRQSYFAKEPLPWLWQSRPRVVVHALQVAPAQKAVRAARAMLSAEASVGELFASAAQMALTDRLEDRPALLVSEQGRQDLLVAQFTTGLVMEHDLLLLFEIARALGFRVVVPGVSTPEEDVLALLATIRGILREEDKACAG